jgi:hypothetical protein
MTVGSLSRSAIIKVEVSRGTGTNVHRAHSAPQTLTPKTDQRGAEARGLAPPHLRHPTDDLDADPHRRHVFVLIAPRYTLVIPKL